MNCNHQIKLQSEILQLHLGVKGLPDDYAVYSALTATTTVHSAKDIIEVNPTGDRFWLLNNNSTTILHLRVHFLNQPQNPPQSPLLSLNWMKLVITVIRPSSWNWFTGDRRLWMVSPKSLCEVNVTNLKNNNYNVIGIQTKNKKKNNKKSRKWFIHFMDSLTTQSCF